MRIQELAKLVADNPDMLFATCDWNMVKPVTPVSTKWYWHTERVDGVAKTEWKILESHDPWAKCGGATKPPITGVLCEVFAYDENGVKKEPLGRMIFPLRDIGGGWGEFLTLHADGVREQGEKRKAQIEQEKWAKEARKRLQDIGITFPIKEIKGREPGDRGYYAIASSTSHANVDVREVYNWDRYKNYTIEPAGYVVPRWLPSISLRAGNAEDVEYLFQVLEAGVKAVEAKQKRAAARKTTKKATKKATEQ